VDGKYRFPDKFMGFIGFKPPKKRPDFQFRAQEMPHGVSTGDMRYEFHRTAFELIFPNLKTGTGELSYYSLYTDQDDEIMISDEIFNALKTWCEWKLLVNSNNVRHPRWSDRQLMRQEAYTAVQEARGNINESHRLSSLR